jgi:hypothetical protein
MALDWWYRQMPGPYFVVRMFFIIIADKIR